VIAIATADRRRSAMFGPGLDAAWPANVNTPERGSSPMPTAAQNGSRPMRETPALAYIGVSGETAPPCEREPGHAPAREQLVERAAPRRCALHRVASERARDAEDERAADQPPIAPYSAPSQGRTASRRRATRARSADRGTAGTS
jgi:hypothetical protein